MGVAAVPPLHRAQAVIWLVLVAQGLDLMTYVQAPHLEAGALAPVAPATVVLVKCVGVALVIVLSSQLRARGRAVVLGAAIAVGAFGAGMNTAALAA